MNIEDTTIGLGWAFPPAFDLNTQAPQMAQGKAEIEQSLLLILRTALGERVMRRTFGSNLHELLFEPLTENTRTYMASQLRQSIARNEPRVRVEDLSLVQPTPDEGRVEIQIELTILATRTPLSLVIPYELPETN